MRRPFLLVFAAVCFVATLFAQDVLNNDSVIKLVGAGLSEDMVVNVVNTQPGKYSLNPDDLIALKKAGVSEKVISAMLAKGGASHGAKREDTPVPRVDAVAGNNGLPVVPAEPGLYYFRGTQAVAVEGQVVSFARTGSLLASGVTLGIKSRKTNVQIAGRKASLSVSERPVFYFRSAGANEAAGGGVGDLVLLQMRVHGDRRQVEVGAAGAWRASSGVSIRSQLEFQRSQVAAGLYRVQASDLKSGQYCFYLFRSYELPAFIYSFGVE